MDAYGGAQKQLEQDVGMAKHKLTHNTHTHTYNLHTRYKSPSQYQTNKSSYIGPASCAPRAWLVKAGKSKPNAGMYLRTSEFLTVSKPFYNTLETG